MTWIIPTNSPISVCAQDMMASDEDSNSLATQLASTYLWRSKPSQVRTWSTRLKKVGWLQAFCTRMLKPSRTESFEEQLISYLRDFRANRSAQQDNEGQTMTHATSGHTSKKALDNVDLPLFSSKMLTELSAHDLEGMTGKTQKERPFCSMSSESWKDWVTGQRQDALQRQKSVLPTNANDGSSWPTATSRDWKGCGNAVDRKDGKHRMDTLEAVAKFGQPDPDNPSTNGNHQGSFDKHTNWATPNTMDMLPVRSEDGLRKQATGARKGRTNPANLREQVDPVANAVYKECATDWPTARTADAEGGPIQNEMGEDGFRSYREKSGQWFGAKLRDAIETHEKQWRTPSVAEEKNQDYSKQVYLQNQVKEQWATPDVSDRRSAKSKQQGLSNQTGGKLNPRWVETLMGVPVGWVSPEPCTPTTCTNRTDELRLLGNGVVPQTCAIAIKTLRERLDNRA